MKDKIQKAKKAEKKFMEYLDKHDIAYWYIQQDLITYSKAMKKYNIQRPDLLVLIPDFGFILVDVEHKLPLKRYQKFCICDLKTKRYENLQKKFNMKMWYAFSNDDVHFSTWYFMSITKAIELRKKYLVKEKNYISAPINSFIQLSNNNKFTRVLAG
tara:strand:+ start:144 stop:614 length:471 start_codon:yes stop_codon:yes gene_type:complete